MATEKNFRVKKGLDVKSGAVTVENAPSNNAADLVVFHNGTSEIGKIAYTATDNIAIYSSTANHAGINLGQSTITPLIAGAETNDAVSLGNATYAFKDLYLSGDLNVAGAINSTATTATNLEIEDITITLNKSDSDSSGTANGAGIIIQDAVDASTDASILWDTTNDEFDFSHKLNIPSLNVQGDITLPDNDPNGTSAKIKLGADPDLEIYHDGTHSYIRDVGTGNLHVDGTRVLLRSAANVDMVKAIGGGAVEIYYAGDKKFETTSNGVLVSGGNVAVGHGVGTQGQVLEDGNTDVATLRFDSESWRIWTGHDPDGAGAGAAIDSELLRLTSGGNLGVGTFTNTAEPTHHLHLMSTTANTNTAEDIIKIESKSSGTTAVGFGANILFNAERADGTQQDQGRIGFIASGNVGTSGSEVLSSDFVIGTATGGTISNKVFVKAGGNVGIGPFISGTTDPARKLHVLGSGSTIAAMIEASDASQASVDLKNTQSWFRLIASSGEFFIYDQTDTAERFRIDTAGNVGIGGVDPTAKLHVDGTTTITGALTLGDIVFPTAKGSANEILAMNAGATALEFVTAYSDSSVDTHLNQSTASANDVLIWSGSDYSWGPPPAINNIALDNTNVTITDNGSDAGYISATVDGTLISTTNADGITVVGNVEATEFIGDVRGAVLFKAKAGEALAKGDVVYIDQYDAGGNQTVVAKANASDAAKMPAFGIAAAAANANANVDIYTFGTLGGLDTSSFSVNDELFVSAATAGALVSTAPTGSANLIQKIAKVLRVDGSAGSIKIMGAGRTNATPNLDAGKIFVGRTAGKAEQGTITATGISSASYDDGSQTITINTPTQDIDDITDANRSIARTLGWVPAIGNNVESSVVWDTTEDAIKLTPDGTGNTGLVHKAFQVFAGQKVHVTLSIKGASAVANGVYAKFYFKSGTLTDGKTHVSDDSANSSSVVEEDTLPFTIIDDGATTTGFVNFEGNFTPSADGYASVALYVASGYGTTAVYIKQPDIKRRSASLNDVLAMTYIFG